MFDDDDSREREMRERECVGRGEDLSQPDFIMKILLLDPFYRTLECDEAHMAVGAHNNFLPFQQHLLPSDHLSKDRLSACVSISNKW